MAQIYEKSTIENIANATSGLNPFAGVSKTLEAKFDSVFSSNSASSNNQQNIKVQSNNYNNTEIYATLNQPSGGHSFEYNIAPNSIFEANSGTDNYYNEGRGQSSIFDMTY